MISIENFIGQKFGKLTIIEAAGQNKRTDRLVLTLCECGKQSVRVLSRITRGKCKSCGCSVNKKVTNDKHLKLSQEMIGRKFNKLTVVSELPTRLRGNRVYLCICECGNNKEVPSDRLKSGTTSSCGCIVKTTTNFEHIYRTYQHSAKKRKLEWSIDTDNFLNITKKICFYCGIEPQQVIKVNSHSQPYTYNGLDRKDNNVGYTVANVVPCCKHCNYAKFTFSHEGFIDWLKRAYNHLQSTQIVLG